MIKYILFTLSLVSASSAGWELLFANKTEAALEVFTETKGDYAQSGLIEVYRYLGEQSKVTQASKPTQLDSSFWVMPTEQYLNLFTLKKLNAKDSALWNKHAKKFGYQDQWIETQIQRTFNLGNLAKAKELLNSGNYIRQWKWFGPIKEEFSQNISAISPFEKKLPDLSEQTSRANGDKISWQFMQNSSYSPWLYLSDHISQTSDAYFLLSSINSPEDQRVILNIGVSARFQVFINGKSAGHSNDFQNTGIGFFRYEVNLQQGENEILLQLAHSQKSLLSKGNEDLNFNLFFSELHSNKSIPFTETILSMKSIKHRELSQEKEIAIVTHHEKRAIALKDLWEKENHKTALYLLAKQHLLYNEFEELEGYIASLKSEFPKSALVKNLLAQYYKWRGDNVNHQKAMNEIYQLDRENYSGWMYRFNYLSSMLNPVDVAEFTQKTPKRFKKSPEFLQAKMYLAFQEQNTGLAMEYIQELIDYPKKSNTLMRNLQMLLPKIGKHKEFEQLLLAEIQTHPAHYSLRLMLYGFYTKVGRKEDAKNTLLNAITFFPNKVDLRYYLANIYFLSKEYTEALAWIENCLIDIPLAENGLKLKANILAALGKKQQAKQTLHILKDYTSYDFVAYDQLRDLEGKQPFFKLNPFPQEEELWNRLDSSELISENKAVLINDQINVIVYGKGVVKRLYQSAVFLPKQSDVDNWKERSFYWNGAFQTFKLLKAITVKRNGEKVNAETGNGPLLFMNVEPGDMIISEWEISDYYEGEVAKHLELNKSHYTKMFQIQSQVNIIHPKEIKIEPTLYFPKQTQKTSKIIDETYNQDSYTFIPKRKIILESYVPAAYSNVKWLKYSSWNNWSEISAWYLKLSEQEIPAELKTLVKRIVKGAATPVEKIGRIHKYIVDNVRYSSVSFRQSGWIPQPILGILSSKIGDCKDMSSLGRAMLSVIGIKSELVLVHTKVKRAFDKVSVGPNFNHAILAYDLDGQKNYMDLTGSNYSYSTLPSMDVGAMALLVQAGEQKLFPLPNQRSKAIFRNNTDSLFSDGSFMRKSITQRKNDYAASFREDYRFLDKKERTKALQKSVGKTYSGAVVSSFVVPDLNVLQDSLSYEYVYNAENVIQNIGKMKLFKWMLADAFLDNSIPSEQTRETPYDYFYWGPSYKENKGKLVFPPNWILLEIPESKSINTQWGRYEISFTVKENELHYQRSLLWSYDNWILPQEYSKFRVYLKNILKYDDLNLLFKPK